MENGNKYDIHLTSDMLLDKDNLKDVADTIRKQVQVWTQENEGIAPFQYADLLLHTLDTTLSLGVRAKLLAELEVDEKVINVLGNLYQNNHQMNMSILIQYREMSGFSDDKEILKPKQAKENDNGNN